MDFAAASERVGALVAPRNVVLVGASDRLGSWAARVWRNLNRYGRNLNRYGFDGRLFPMNPGRSEIGGEVCYPDFASLPEKTDHLVILAPAAHVLLQEALPRAIGSPRAEKYIRIVEEYAAQPGKPIACITMASHGQSDYSRAQRADAPHLPFLQEANKALRAIQHVVERDRRIALAGESEAIILDTPVRSAACDRVRALAADGVRALSEVESKSILAAYDLPLPREATAAHAKGAAAAARAIGPRAAHRRPGAGRHHHSASSIGVW